MTSLPVPSSLIPCAPNAAALAGVRASIVCGALVLYVLAPTEARAQLLYLLNKPR